MTSIADGSVEIQTTAETNFSTPAWFGEVVLISSYLQKHGVLKKITEQVHFARKRFGRYDLIDFLVVQIALCHQWRTYRWREFYERLQPFAVPFMALFERDRLPSRSALSRFLAALTEGPVEALRTLFLDDLLARPLTPTSKREGWWIAWETPGPSLALTGRGRRRGLAPYPRPMTFLHPFADWLTSVPPETLAASAERRSEQGQRCLRLIRYQWLGSFGNRGNGLYRTELRQGLAAIRHYRRARISSRKNGRCSASMANMGTGLC